LLALRSGTYRVLTPDAGSDPGRPVRHATIDASTLGIVYADGSPGAWVAHATQACRFNRRNRQVRHRRVAGRVIVARSSEDDGTFHPIIAFPEQTHTLAELAGTWNVIGVNPNDAGTAYAGVRRPHAGRRRVISAVSAVLNEATWTWRIASPTQRLNRREPSTVPGLRRRRDDRLRVRARLRLSGRRRRVDAHRGL